jgi:hypothetical protein
VPLRGEGKLRAALDAFGIDELGAPAPPREPAALAQAVHGAVSGIGGAGWNVRDVIESPVRGRRSAVEFLLHAIRARDSPRA